MVPALNNTTSVEIKIKGVCELTETLVLTAADSNTRYIGVEHGAVLSAGTQLHVPMPQAPDSRGVVEVDLSQHGFSASNLGTLKGRVSGHVTTLWGAPPTPHTPLPNNTKRRCRYVACRRVTRGAARALM